MSSRHIVMFAALSLLWGTSFMFVEIALRDLDPLPLSAARSGIATLMLAAVVTVRRSRRKSVRLLRRRTPRLLVVGVVGVTLPLLLAAWGQQYVDSGFAAILNASTPLWAALLALLFVRSEAVTGTRLLGFALGFGGVVVAVGTGPKGDVRALLGSLAIVVAAGCYAAAALYTARRLDDVPATLVTLGAMGTTAAVLALPALLSGGYANAGWESVAAVVALGVGNGTLAALLYFALIAGAGPASTTLAAYVVPIVAVFCGVVLLGEPLTAAAVVGTVLILGGVGVGTGTVRRRGRAATPAPAPALATPVLPLDDRG